MILLDGKLASASVKENLKKEVDKIIEKNLRPPHLAAILIGNNGASETYVASKIKSCKEVGFTSTLIRYEESVLEKV
ncbi:MAG TPA: tetrahydrofolate dehydrogenase/cyclohydrolase catalytic domain-containing protein, partial [Chitinophagaceae bacterium]|nr:tetrahydrofolate dehydrogenase/cyclohydrolase catalytic domain-containing protein [Chitinophagaceae bacterium]